ncbi:CaiB/BaiF CoA transferase family protein [Arcticibacterium luteifluviistationis]|uniref:CoA transferase n=1 Tax=Arcticibacterium luteifluviistationis TaxID=1784714 RepID=A0A2Z4G6H1_9BACT|nr:CaiB/BaiF CoA-transferase family protein [Arcticibacterium luteifluviistationis]AWV96741.1 CoA transferase [Arcticibacterium luteifluviistationis]
MLPLQDILILDFTQFLSGPIATLRLADLGARVIKVERRDKGDLSRTLYKSNIHLNGASSIFHALNRNKESIAIDLKDENDLAKIKKLISQVDVVVQNFRPAVFEKLGLGYDEIKRLNPSVVYAEVSGYGLIENWKKKPGQDLLVQAISGIAWLTGNKEDGPIPMGLAVADIFAGAHLTQGILAGLYSKIIHKTGCKIEVSLLESILDLQFEMLTTYFNDGGQDTIRTETNNAHAYLGAPYGIYESKDGHIAIAMASIPVLGDLLSCEPLLAFQTADSWFKERDKIKGVLSQHLKTETSKHWLSLLEPADIWCAEVLDIEQLTQKEAFQTLEMLQKVKMSDGFTYETTRCPITFDGTILTHQKGSPKMGEHTIAIEEEFGL